MKRIQIKNGCVFYYGNPAGYIEDEKAVLDPMFKSEELEGWLNQRKLIPKWTDGVFERLSRGGGIISNEEIVALKNCRIWQLKTDVCPGRKFIGYDELMKNFGEIDRDNYRLVYDGEIETNDLEEIYTKFNLDHPKGFEGHSLSISDLVEFYDSTGSECYYVDRFGFKEIDFQAEEQSQDMEMTL